MRLGAWGRDAMDLIMVPVACAELLGLEGDLDAAMLAMVVAEREEGGATVLLSVSLSLSPSPTWSSTMASDSSRVARV